MKVTRGFRGELRVDSFVKVGDVHLHVKTTRYPRRPAFTTVSRGKLLEEKNGILLFQVEQGEMFALRVNHEHIKRATKEALIKAHKDTLAKEVKEYINNM